MRIVAFTGNSNSGKTTLIEKISLCIKTHSPKKRIGIIKHDPKDKAILDTKGKDSARFFDTGADIAILGTTQTTLRFHHPLNFESFIDSFKFYDYLFIEGLKQLPLPKICVARNTFDIRFLPYIQAIAMDSSINKESLVSYNLPLLDLNEIEQILEWINTNIKES